jgi:hypothetical protein
MSRSRISSEQKQQWLREQHSPALLSDAASMGFAERHYSAPEVAAMWRLSQDTVRKIFENEPGVLVLGGNASRHKRRYTTLRVPESVLRRVHRRMTKA